MENLSESPCLNIDKIEEGKPLRMSRISMKKFRFVALILTGGVVAALAEVERAPLRVGTSIDIGQIVKGEISEGTEETGQFLSRTGVAMTQKGTINKRLDVTVGVGGLFWYSLPVSPGAPHTRLVKFGPGVNQASGLFRFGDVDDPSLVLEFGYFPHKYNPDAKNLGEYQFRSGTYPGYLWTGGWSIVNSAAYMAQGVKMKIPTFGGKLTHDLMLYMERDFEPTYDISPSYQAAWKPSEAFEMGLGATWAHGIPVKPSLTTPKDRANAYLGDSALSPSEWNKAGYDLNDPHVVPDGDPRAGTAHTDGKPYVTVTENGIPNSQLSYYTFQGIKLMGRASFNPQAWLASTALGPQDLKLYAEFAILGVQNYPFYYEDITERMPIMFGFNLPTFKILDVLSIEVEYYKSRFQSNIRDVFQLSYPKWQLPPDQTTENYQAFIDSSSIDTEDDWHWSIYGRKALYDGLDLFIQVASDHMRVLSFNAEPSNIAATRKPNQWYYLARLEMGF
jgi:hypothetical protein